MDIQLLIQAKDKPEKSITIKKDVVIGRSQTCQFRVLSNDVSREHCRIVVGNDSVAVRDLGSSNGSVVNGKPIPPQIDFPIQPGDKLEVGPLTVVFDFESSVAAAKSAAATSRPAQTPAPVVAEMKQKAVSKPTSAPAPVAAETKKSAAPKPAAEVAAAQQIKKPKPPVKSDESSIPVFVASMDDDSMDGTTWSNFGEELSGDLTLDVPELANQYGLAESDVDFQLDPTLPDDIPDEPEPEPIAEAPVAAQAPAPQPTAAESEEGESSDEPIFGDFDESTESEFAFDPDQASPAADSVPAPQAVPPSPAKATAAAASSQPGKLKSLFGLFGKGKKEAAVPAKTAAASVASAPVAAAMKATEAESPFDVGAGGGEVDDMTGWLLGGGTPAIHEEPVAIAPAPAAPKPKAAKKPAPAAASSAATKAVATPKAAPKATPAVAPAPPVAAAPQSENADDFNDFFSQLGN